MNNKKIFLIVSIVALLLAILFVLSTIFEERLNNQNLNGSKDSNLLDRCNKVLNTKIFETAEAKDEFIKDCSNGLVDLTEYESTSTSTPEDILSRAEKFSAKLEEVNVGCFVDGECFIKAGGNHVTILMGFKGGVVGKIIAKDDSIGGLEKFIGQEVEVYAQKLSDKTYTLYDSSDFYIKVK